MLQEHNHQEHGKEDHVCCGPGYASPEEAMSAEREKVLYTVALYVGTETEAPDYLATVDVDPNSPTYSQVIHRTPMPSLGDELHHFGWNACSSCYDDEDKSRRFLIVPGFRSSRIHIIDTQNERAPELYKLISPQEVKSKTNLSAPHTVHCLADGTVMISMLGDAEGNAPGGFLLLDENFDIAGRWETTTYLVFLGFWNVQPTTADVAGILEPGSPQAFVVKLLDDLRQTLQAASTDTLILRRRFLNDGESLHQNAQYLHEHGADPRLLKETVEVLLESGHSFAPRRFGLFTPPPPDEKELERVHTQLLRLRARWLQRGFTGG